MSENLYIMGNFAAPSTTAPAPVSSGTAGSPCVMLQLATPASGTRQFCIVEYGVSMTGVPSGASLLLQQYERAHVAGPQRDHDVGMAERGRNDRTGRYVRYGLRRADPVYEHLHQ